MMTGEERVAMARLFTDSSIEDVYEIIATAMNVLEQRDEDLKTLGCAEDDCDEPPVLFGDSYQIAYDVNDESWRLKPT